MRALLAAAALLLFGCGGGSSPRPAPTPTPTPPVTIDTEAGRLAVVSYGCEPDLPRFIREVNTSTRVARRESPARFGGAPLTGFEIHARSPKASGERCHGRAACFERWGSRGRLHVWCSGGGVEHEIAHALAHAVGLPCWRDIYHNGVNFRCEAGP